MPGVLDRTACLGMKAELRATYIAIVVIDYACHGGPAAPYS